MKINPSLFISKSSSERKKREKVTSKRSFHQLMCSPQPPKQVHKKQSVFDMATKKEKRKNSSLIKKETDHILQHGENSNFFTSRIDMDTSDVETISELSEETALLSEQMTNFILTESQKGVTTTTVIVEMKGSPLDGSHIILDHYDTAPHSFNLQLSGSPEGVDLFAANLASLQNALITHPSLQEFQVRILPPVLNEKSTFYLKKQEKRIKRSGEKKGKNYESKKNSF